MAEVFRAVRRMGELLKEFDGRMNNLENVAALTFGPNRSDPALR